jgi:hypothetical protein
LQSLKEK